MAQKSIPLSVLIILLLTVIACGSSQPITPTPPATSTPGQGDTNITATATAENNDNNGDQATTPTDIPTSIPPTPTPAPTETPASMPENPPITLEASPDAIRLTFDIGATSITYTGVLEDTIDYFLIDVRAGQIMTVIIEADGGVGLSVATPSGIPLKHSAVGGPSFSGELPENGDYHIIVVSLYDGVGPINYKMTITIPPLESPD